ncbi:MAG: NADH-quinone oxidoreductase subunit NuoK [Planctomycetota bacterium]|nr:NADH-quinone oxidoreductase subunit NuoK [Planctomycetota bacterium]MDI6788269.1 NADH-quinone oxidoreductase subunit NuoK [Planctomycetota bacterium]
MITLQHFLLLSAILFCLGLYIVLTRKSAVAILMGIELILNAASISFIAFGRFVVGSVDAQVFVIFIIIVAVCEAAVALAIILNIYQNFRTVDVDETRELKY